jgi:hypothetical protein
VFGCHEYRLGLVNGQLRKRVRRIPPDARGTCLRDHHPAYIGWDEFMANQKKLRDNDLKHTGQEGRGAAREGSGLLQGLVLAERRYKAIDPDYRVVARTLEREWNERLIELEQVEQEHHELRQRERLDLSEEDRRRIVALAKDLPAVWRAKTTTNASARICCGWSSARSR